jgi:hypothetical protein
MSKNPFLDPPNLTCTLLETITVLQTNQCDITNNQSELTTRLNSLVISQIGSGSVMLTDQVQSLGQIISTPKALSVPRFKEPTVFTGKLADVDMFIHEIQGAWKLQCTSLITEDEKITYLATYLGSGAPKKWFTLIEKAKPHLLTNSETLLNNFKTHFGDSNIAATSLFKLQRLRQTNMCSAYCAKFTKLLAHVDLSKQTQIHYFKEGLKPDVHDALALHSRHA